MRKHLLIVIFLFSITSFGQSTNNEITPSELAFQKGEWLKFRMSYSNFLNAGFATIKVEETKKGQEDAFHILGEGKSTGIVSWFFKVKDDYQTYMYKETLKPYRFIRKINEGGYRKDKKI